MSSVLRTGIAVLKAVRVEIRVSGDKSNKLLIVHLGLEIVIVL